MKFDGKPIACMCKINIWIYRALSKHLFEVQDDCVIFKIDLQNESASRIFEDGFCSA